MAANITTLANEANPMVASSSGVILALTKVENIKQGTPTIVTSRVTKAVS